MSSPLPTNNRRSSSCTLPCTAPPPLDLVAGVSPTHYSLLDISIPGGFCPLIKVPQSPYYASRQPTPLSFAQTHTMSTPATLSSSSSYTGHLTNGDPRLAKASYKPTHPGSFEVTFREGEYNSCLVALKVRVTSGVTALFSLLDPPALCVY